jgi:hypothetical protein
MKLKFAYAKDLNNEMKRIFGRVAVACKDSVGQVPALPPPYSYSASFDKSRAN